MIKIFVPETQEIGSYYFFLDLIHYYVDNKDYEAMYQEILQYIPSFETVDKIKKRERLSFYYADYDRKFAHDLVSFYNKK